MAKKMIKACKFCLNVNTGNDWKALIGKRINAGVFGSCDVDVYLGRDAAGNGEPILGLSITPNNECASKVYEIKVDYCPVCGRKLNEATMDQKDWWYGKEMLEQGDIESLDEWSDDKEYCCSIMDNEFDYMWDFDKGIHFIDRLYTDCLAEIESGRIDSADEYDLDEMSKARLKRNEAELWFDSFDDVKKFIEERRAK